MKIRARAPLRLGLAGGGTDVSPYCDLHGGMVMNATIDKYAFATVQTDESGLVRYNALDRGVCTSFKPEDAPGEIPSDLRLMNGVFRRISRDYLNGGMPAISITTYSDAPPGSGLGSSSTMVVAIVTALAEYFRLPLGEYEIAKLAHEVERNDLALAGGKQDQYAAAFGGFNFMEFGANDRVIVNPLRMKERVINELEASTVLYFTGVSRESAQIIDEQVKNASSGAADPLLAMHELKDEAIRMKEDLLQGDIRGFAHTLQRGWLAKKRMATSISNPVIERAEALGVAHGAIATKVSGAGGGGFMMFICDPDDRVRLVNALRETHGSVLDFHFTPYGATAWKA